VLVINCLLLILLVLVQLPKKDAGAGLAFGGGAADALFGAGSGNALTKITKYAAIFFFALAVFLGYLENKLNGNADASSFTKQVQQKQQMSEPIVAPLPAPPANTQPAVVPTTNLLSFPMTAGTNASAAPAPADTNMPAAPAPAK
jgi:preprotein translocase subunit SecG